MELLDVRRKIGAADAEITETIVSTGRVTPELEGVNVDGQWMPYTSRAFEQLCDRFRHSSHVPASYLSSLPGSSTAKLVEHHLASGLEGGDRISIYNRGGEVVGLGRPDLFRLSGVEVFEAVVEGVGGRADDLEFTGLSFHDDTVRFDVVTKRSEREVRPGDAVYGGVTVSHSLIAANPTHVEGFVYRLKCLNGAMHRECLRPREGRRTRRLPVEHRDARHQQREQIRLLTGHVFETLTGRMMNLNRLANQPADLDHFAATWLRRSRLSPDRLLPRLRQALEQEGGEQTAYGVMNAFTRVATHHTDLPANVRTALARMGGLLGFGHSEICSKCWSLIANNN
jgi:hypothetical protein